MKWSSYMAREYGLRVWRACMARVYGARVWRACMARVSDACLIHINMILIQVFQVSQAKYCLTQHSSLPN